MKLKSTFFLILICLLSAFYIKAQTPPYTYIPDAQNWECGFSPMKMNQMSADTGFMNSMGRYNSNLNNPTMKFTPVPTGPYIIPVVFHLIDATTPTIPYAQIQWQMARLNAAFSNQMNLFNGQANSPRGVNTQIEFRLACVAQNSLSAWTSSVEPGVMRYATTNTVVLNQGVAPNASTVDMLAITHPTAFPTTFPFSNYLNIWCVPNIGSGNIAGYGTFPVGNFGGIDGIVMRLDMIGNNSYPTNFNIFGQLDKGAVLAHEAGHYLGLYHTFESMPSLSGVLGCYGTSPTDATTDGDLLLDTPPTMYAQDLGSILSVNSCTETNSPYGGPATDENDQLENYMCYSDDDKLNAFTQDQANRMVANFNTIGNPRFTLNDPTNLSATGVLPNSCVNNSGLLTAIFNHSLQPGATCSSSVIQFTNPQSLGFTATSWNWNFGDGNTGTGASPTHTYSTASGTLFIATCTASDGTTTATYSASISISFDVFISGQSGLNMPVCKGSEQTIYITFGVGIPSAILTDGTNQFVVNNYMNSTNPTFGPKVIPYTFIINNSATYNLVPASCGTINLGAATFSVIECCNNSITNGDFSAGSTSFTTDLSLGAAPGGTNPTYFGTYTVAVPGSPSAWIPTIGTNLMNVTGNALNVDGFNGNNGIVNITSTSLIGCVSSSQTPAVWQQTLTGLKPSTQYYYSFKVTENYFPFQSSNICAQMNFATSITYSTSSFALPTQTLVPVPHIMGAPTNKFNYVVYTYTFNTPATTSTATPFSIQINQTNNFIGAFFDYFIDNITLNEMTSGIQAIGSNTICSSQSTTLSAIANCNNSLVNYNYVWSPSAGLSSSTIMSPVAHPTATTIYTLIASPTTTVGGLSAVISTVTVTVIPSINIPVNSPSICIGQGFTLTATGASNYSWSPGGATTSSIVVTPTATSIYTVTTTNTVAGCPSSVTATVNVSPPTVISPTNIVICSGNSTTLTASGATTYSWNTGATTNTVSVAPTVTTIYTVTGTTGGCANTKTITITVNTTPTVAVNNATICSGTSTVLTASGASTYSWNTGATTNTISVSPSSTTIYTVTGTSNGCSNTKTVSVTVKTTPTVTVNSPTICAGQTTTLTATGATTYSWNTSATTNSISVNPTSTTNYTVTGTTNGCSNTKTTTVTVNPSPTVTAVANPTSICVGQTSTLTVSGATTYSWNTGVITSTISVSPSATTVYTVTGTTSSCSSSATVAIIVGPATPTITASTSSVNACSGGSATLTAIGATNYTWTPGGINTSTAVVTPTAAIIYTLSGSYGSGCNTATTTLLVNPIISTLCCSTTTNVIGTSLTSSVNLAGTFSSTIYDVQGVVTFTSNTTFTGCTLRMKANTLLKLADNVTLTFTNCKLFSCSELWDGILISTTTYSIHSYVSINNTTIEDMYNGIVYEGNNRGYSLPMPTADIISIIGSKLNKNYISVQVRNSTGGPEPTSMPFSVKSSTLASYSSTTSPGSSLKPSLTYTYAYNTWPGGATSSTNTPFVNFPRTYTGIYLYNVTRNFTLIGDSTTSANTNTFDNMDFGIRGIEASAKVHNNYFKNITGSAKQTANGESWPASGPDEIGIAVAMTHTYTNWYNLTVGSNTIIPVSGTPYPKGNKFEDCNRAIYASNCKAVYIKSNQFNPNTATTATTSIVPLYGVDAYYYYKNNGAVWVSGLSERSTLSYNYIRNFNKGLYASHTFTDPSFGINSIDVSNNNIASPSSTGYCLQAIQVAQVGGANPTTGALAVTNNTMVNIYNGIQANNIQTGLYVYNNNINIESMTKALATTSTTVRQAIKMIYCSGGQIKANSVTSNGAVPTTSITANYLTGIYVVGSTSSKVECNNAYHLGRGFVFEGACGSASWKVNTMSDSYRGMEMRLAAVIGNQGAPSGSGTPNLSANTWTTTTEETYVFGTTNVNTASKLYLLNNVTGVPKTLPTANYPTASTSRYQTGPLNGLQVTTGTSYTCNAGNAQRMANGNNTSSGSNNQKTVGVSSDSLIELTNLATAAEDSYEVFADEMMYQNKQFVYQLIEQDSINPTKNSTLSAFYNSTQNTAIDKLTEAQIAIANFDISSASSSNSSAPVASAIEQKQQRANELILKYMNDQNYIFTNNEKIDLRNMANECLAKGDYVTHARNLVDVFTHNSILYQDECEAEANASRKKKINNNVVNRTFNLYPNPNNGMMTLDYDLGYDTEATIKLFDVTGKLISIYTMQNTKGSIGINERNLTNGIYFYSILVKEKVIKNDKIVIIR